MWKEVQRVCLHISLYLAAEAASQKTLMFPKRINAQGNAKSQSMGILPTYYLPPDEGSGMEIIMKRRVFIIPILLLAVLISTGCQAKGETIQREISDALGVDVGEGIVVASEDSHGGFHGDGMYFVTLRFPDGTFLDQTSEVQGWKNLPLSENLTKLVYGIEDDASKIGPYLTKEIGEPVIPDVQNGCYYFLDRHSKSVDGYDDSDVLNRGSLNLTVAIYDMDTDTLYYVEYDS